jgi:hypothetical protein
MRNTTIVEVHDLVHVTSWHYSKQERSLSSIQEVSEGSENLQSESLFVEDRNRPSDSITFLHKVDDDRHWSLQIQSQKIAISVDFSTPVKIARIPTRSSFRFSKQDPVNSLFTSPKSKKVWRSYCAAESQSPFLRSAESIVSMKINVDWVTTPWSFDNSRISASTSVV